MIIYTCIESTCHTPNIFTSLYVICISIKMFKGTKTSFSLTALPFAPPTPAPSTFPSSLSPFIARHSPGLGDSGLGHDSAGTLPQAGPQSRVCPCCSRSRSLIDRILSGAALPLRLLIHPLPTAFDSRPSSRLGSRTEGVAAFLSFRGTRVSSHKS